MGCQGDYHTVLLDHKEQRGEEGRKKIFAVFWKKSEMKSEGEYFIADNSSCSQSKAVKCLCKRQSGTQL